MEHLAKKPVGVQTRWTSFENPLGEKGKGGTANNCAKGSAWKHIPAKSTVTLMEHTGAGEIRRIWVTIRERSPSFLRALTLRCYWDGSDKPAVEVPFGDFMCMTYGAPCWDSAFFSSPEGTSFNCYIPMPFRTGAKITLTNETDVTLSTLFYKISYLVYDKPQEDLLYFHSYFHRSNPVELEKDHIILPKVTGQGRYLGASFVLNANPIYGDWWWGEGEIKLFVDGDRELPTLIGTGTEDYIGTGWGQGQFACRYFGSLVADPKAKRWTFYRFHVADPVYFQEDLKVSIQDMGGSNGAAAKAMVEDGIPLTPVNCDDFDGNPGGPFRLLYEDPSQSWPDEGWVEFFRQDDIATVAYFYLDRPASELPPIQSMQVRLAGMDPIKQIRYGGGQVPLP